MCKLNIKEINETIYKFIYLDKTKFKKKEMKKHILLIYFSEEVFMVLTTSDY